MAMMILSPGLWRSLSLYYGILQSSFIQHSPLSSAKLIGDFGIIRRWRTE
jgi:hypothetical protein